MKYSRVVLKVMANKVWSEINSRRALLLVMTVSVRTGLSPNQVKQKILELT